MAVLDLDFRDKYAASLVMPVTDTEPPVVVSGPVVVNVTDSSAEVRWMTDEPASSVASVNGVAVSSNEAFLVEHAVVIEGLDEDTGYDVSLSLTDRSGNGPTEASATFNTVIGPKPGPPVFLSGPLIISYPNSALMTWTTNEPTTWQVQWKLTQVLRKPAVGCRPRA